MNNNEKTRMGARIDELSVLREHLERYRGALQTLEFIQLMQGKALLALSLPARGRRVEGSLAVFSAAGDASAVLSTSKLLPKTSV